MTQKIDLNACLAELGPKFAAKSAAHDADARFVADNYAALREHKLFSAQVPSELGGGGASHDEICAFVRGLGRYCSSTALAFSMHQHLVAAAVFNHKNGNPGKALLEKVAANELVLVSTGANDWLGSNGEVEKADGGYLVSAAKPFASGSVVGNVAVTSAPYHDPEAGWQVLHFPVPLNAEGVRLAGDWDTLGMRGTGSETLILEKVFVPEEAVALRRPRDDFHPAWNVILTVAMPIIMSAYMGVAEAAAEIAQGQAKKRTDGPETVYLLGELANELTAAQLAVDAMVAIAAGGNFTPSLEITNAILVRKTLAVRGVMAVGQKALEVAGGSAYYRKLGLEQRFRDLQAARYHPLPEKKQQRFTGRLELGLDPIRDTEEEPAPALKAVG